MEKLIESLLSKVPFLQRRLDFHMREVVIHTSVAMSLRVVGGLLGLSFNLLLARKLGADGTGLYFLTLNIVTVVAALGCLGLGNSLLRFIAANASVEDWAAVKGVYEKGMKLAMSGSVLFSVGLFLSAPWISEFIFHKSELTGPLRWMCVFAPFYSFLSLQAESLKALKRIRDWVLVSGVSVELLSLAGLALVGNRWGVEGAAVIFGSAVVLSGGLGFGLWKKATPHLKKLKGNFDTGELLKSSIPLFWTGVLTLATDRIPILFLGIWASKVDVGVYGVAIRLATIVSLVLIAVNSISAPKFAGLYRNGEKEALNSLAQQSAKLMTVLAAPVLLLFILFPDFFMGIFGLGFRSGAMILSILAFGQFINVATGSVAYLLMMSGNEKILRNRAVFMFFWCAAISLLLIPRMGIMGAALSTTICMVTTNLIALFMVRLKLGIWTLPFALRKH